MEPQDITPVNSSHHKKTILVFIVIIIFFLILVAAVGGYLVGKGLSGASTQTSSSSTSTVSSAQSLTPTGWLKYSGTGFSFYYPQNFTEFGGASVSGLNPVDVVVLGQAPALLGNDTPWPGFAVAIDKNTGGKTLGEYLAAEEQKLKDTCENIAIDMGTTCTPNVVTKVNGQTQTGLQLVDTTGLAMPMDLETIRNAYVQLPNGSILIFRMVMNFAIDQEHTDGFNAVIRSVSEL